MSTDATDTTTITPSEAIESAADIDDAVNAGVLQFETTDRIPWSQLPEVIGEKALHDDCLMKLKGELADRTMRCREAADHLKLCRKSEKNAADAINEEVQRFYAWAADALHRYENPDASTALPSEAGSSPNSPPDYSHPVFAQPTRNLALWDIPSISRKKAAAIAEQYATVGDLEQLRAQGSGKGIGLQSIARVGPELAQKIEDRLIEFVAKFCAGNGSGDGQQQTVEAATSEPASEAVEEPATEQPAADAPPAKKPRKKREPKPESEQQKIISDEAFAAWEAMTDEQRAEFFTARAELLEGNGDEDALSCKSDEGAYRSGREAFLKSWKMTDCPYVPGPIQDDWIRGYISEDVAAASDDGSDAEYSGLEAVELDGEIQSVEFAEPQPAAAEPAPALTTSGDDDDYDFLN